MSTTRSQSKQEEQLATLVAMLEEQKEEQQRQSERLERLLQRHEQNQHQLEERQQNTSQQMEMLQEDVGSLKTLLHDQVGGMETELAAVLERQKQIKVEQKILRQELKEELMHEMKRSLQDEVSSRALDSTLRVSAEPFIPASGAEVPAVAGALATKPATYDGKTTWDAYRAQFELLAELNQWNDVQKATILAVNLRGPAVTVLTNIPSEDRQNFEVLTAALERRFGSAHQTELNRAQLRARTRHKEETLPELAEDVDRITRLAYPDASTAMLQVLARDQFIDSLTDEEMRLRVRQNRPSSLKEALQCALELESYQLASRHRRGAGAVREVQLEANSKAAEQKQMVQLQQLQDEIQKMQKSLEAIQRIPEQGNQRPNQRQRGRVPVTSNIICWNCRKRGHIQRDCKESPVSQSGNEQ